MTANRATAMGAPSLVQRVGIAWSLVSMLLLAVNSSAIANLRFPDPDDVMRLVQVRDWINGQSWFDVTQYRVDAAAGGVAMHWSRLVDIPIALVIVAFEPILGKAYAELTAMIIVPLITLGLAMFLAARIAWLRLGGEETNFACLIMALSVPLVFQMGPLRIDHHGWQIVCALAAVNGIMAQSPKLGGWAIGASLAVWLSISIEGLPLAAAIFGVLAWRWWRGEEARAWLVHAMRALAVTGIGLFLLTRGLSDLANYCDAISPVHLAMFVWGAAILSLLAQFQALPRPLLFAGFALAGGGALTLLFSTAPQCVGDGFSELDPLVGEYWHDRVSEGMPVWRQSISTILNYAIAPLIGLAAALRLAWNADGQERQWWAEYAVVLLAAFVVSLLVARAGAVAGALAAVPLAWQIRSWFQAIRLVDRLLPRLAATLGVMMALLPAFPMMVFSWAAPVGASDPAQAPEQAIMAKASECRVVDSAQQLRALDRGEIYAMLDMAPQILFATDHSVIATPHHRGDRGMRIVIETAMASEADAALALRERGSAYVALCTNLGEPQLYAKFSPGGFVAGLIAGQSPDWLEPVPMAQEGSLKVWRIKPE